MSKSKYIKVTDANKLSSVVMAANEAFYESQGYQVSEPTQDEIDAYFPTTVGATASKQDVSDVENKLHQVKTELAEERAEHLTTGNKLIAAQSELHQVKTELESVQKELDKLKKKA